VALVIDSISVAIQNKLVISRVSLVCMPGTIHVIMGPNGSGKSSLAYTLMGHSNYELMHGSIKLFDTEIIALSPDKRAQQGLFLSLQHPIEIPGLTVFNFLKEAYYALHGIVSLSDFQSLLYNTMSTLGIDHSFAYRNVHEGFSGGEKKRLEILQLLVLKPKVAILDEIDSGLDVDALKIVARGIQHARNENPDLCLLLITHYQRILRYIQPDYVHIMNKGSLIASGDASLAEKVEQKGYDGIIL
jgi:Fe-S cluster assembly ATP-binding protein